MSFSIGVTRLATPDDVASLASVLSDCLPSGWPNQTYPDSTIPGAVLTTWWFDPLPDTGINTKSEAFLIYGDLQIEAVLISKNPPVSDPAAILDQVLRLELSALGSL